MSFQMYLTPPVNFKHYEHEKFAQKMEKLRKARQEYRTPQKEKTKIHHKLTTSKKVQHRKVKSLNTNRSFMLPSLVPMSAEQFRKFLNNFKNK